MTIDNMFLETVTDKTVRVEIPRGSRPIEVVNQSGLLFLWYEKSDGTTMDTLVLFLLRHGDTIPNSVGYLNSMQKRGRVQVYYRYES